MEKDEYRDALGKLGLTQEEVGRILGAGKRTARRWASGEARIPGPVEMHIRMWLDMPIMLDAARSIREEIDCHGKGKV